MKVPPNKASVREITRAIVLRADEVTDDQAFLSSRYRTKSRKLGLR